MNFPVVFHLAGVVVPAHNALELLGYSVGFLKYARSRERKLFASESVETSAWLIVCCLVGALVGSKVLAWMESPLDYWPARNDPRILIGGKTIVGGLLGAWMTVEVGKRLLHVNRRTGDAFVFPLVIGIAIGRVGCFLEGLPDHTYGIATRLPWGIDFGDGIHRHPTQIYEIIFVLLLGLAIQYRSRRPFARGDLFRWFMFGYFSFRFLIEFIKPRYTGYFGLSMIQLASLCGACVAMFQLIRGAQLPRDSIVDAT